MIDKKTKGESSSENEEKSLREFILSIKSFFAFLYRRKIWVISSAFIGALIGGLYYKMAVKGKYVAESTFVLYSNTSQNPLSSLAVIGLDVSNGNVGLFSDMDNIVWLYKSNKMISRALMSETIVDGKSQTIIEWFIKIQKLKKQIDKDPSLRDVKWSGQMDSFNTSQQAILNLCSSIIRKDLNVSTVPKTQNIISVTFKSADEKFACAFNKLMVETVNSFYIQSRILKSKKEVEFFQKKVDSFKNTLNASMVSEAELVDNVPYSNPNKIILRVPPKKKGVDVEINSKVYVEAKLNLENSKMALEKETPLIQEIESPNFPLSYLKTSIATCLLIGFILSLFLATVAIFLLYTYNRLIKQKV